MYDSGVIRTRPSCYFDEVRRAGDVVWSPKMQRWLVVSYRSAKLALQSPDFAVYDIFQAYRKLAGKTGIDVDAVLAVGGWVPFLFDGARHRKLRALHSKALAYLRDRYESSVRRHSARLLGAMRAKGAGDFVQDFSDRLHIEAVLDSLSMADCDRRLIASNAASEGVIDYAFDLRAVVDANSRIALIIGQIEQQLRTEPQNPSVVHLIALMRDCGLEHCREDFGNFLTALLMLGRDTLSGALSLLVGRLASEKDGIIRPEDWQSLVGREDEIFRVTSPVHIVSRVARVETELSGQKIHPGETLMVFLPAAGKDPAQMGCPDSIGTSAAPSVAFGAGRHLCAGMNWSRAVMRVVLDQLSDCPAMEVSKDRRFGLGLNTQKFAAIPCRFLEPL